MWMVSNVLDSPRTAFSRVSLPRLPWRTVGPLYEAYTASVRLLAKGEGT